MGLENSIESIERIEGPCVLVKGNDEVSAAKAFESLSHVLYDFFDLHGPEPHNLIMPTSNKDGIIELKEGQDRYAFPVYIHDETIERMDTGKTFYVPELDQLFPIVDENARPARHGIVTIHVDGREKGGEFKVYFTPFTPDVKRVEERDAFMKYIQAEHPGVRAE